MFTDVPDHNSVLLIRVPFTCVGAVEPHLRGSCGQRHTSVFPIGDWLLVPFIPPGRSLQSQDLGAGASGDLFGQGVVIRPLQSTIQGSLDCGDPLVMEVVKNARVDTGPIVNRHRKPPAASASDDSIDTALGPEA